VRKWTKRAIEPYEKVIYERLPSYLPPDIDYLSKESFPYELPSVNNNPWLSLNDGHKALG